MNYTSKQLADCIRQSAIPVEIIEQLKQNQLIHGVPLVTISNNNQHVVTQQDLEFTTLVLDAVVEVLNCQLPRFLIPNCNTRTIAEWQNIAGTLLLICQKFESQSQISKENFAYTIHFSLDYSNLKVSDEFKDLRKNDSRIQILIQLQNYIVSSSFKSPIPNKAVAFNVNESHHLLELMNLYVNLNDIGYAQKFIKDNEKDFLKIPSKIDLSNKAELDRFSIIRSRHLAITKMQADFDRIKSSDGYNHIIDKRSFNQSLIIQHLHDWCKIEISTLLSECRKSGSSIYVLDHPSIKEFMSAHPDMLSIVLECAPADIKQVYCSNIKELLDLPLDGVKDYIRMGPSVLENTAASLDMDFL